MGALLGAAHAPAGATAGSRNPRRNVGRDPCRGVAFWLVFLDALTAAIGALKIPAVTSFINQVLAYLPNVIAAVLIFVVASAVATAVVAAVQKTMGDTPTGKVVETVVPLEDAYPRRRPAADDAVAR